MAKGFFSKNELVEEIRVEGCQTCGLSQKGCLSPRMKPTGEGKKKILIVAEAPGEDEDRLNTQLVGKVGQRLRRTLVSLGYDLDSDCRKTNACICRPPKNETPTPIQISSCRRFLMQEIEKTKPNVIIPLGRTALSSLVGPRWKRDNDMSISRWRSYAIPDHDLGAWLCPTFHPSFIERSDHYNPAVDAIWRRDLAIAMSLWDKPLPKKPDPDIRILRGPDIEKYLLSLWQRGKATQMVMEEFPFYHLTPGTDEWMEYWRANPRHQHKMLEHKKNPVPLVRKDPFVISLDYETTGLKPYRSCHEIVCCSISEGPEVSHAWMFKGSFLTMFRSICELPTIRKIGGNIKFEEVWTRAKCGHEIEGWDWDTVIAAKTLDNRLGNSSVKFQAYVRLGIIGYDDYVSQYLRSTDGTSNGLNRVREIPPRELLEYCGRDSAFEYGIALAQKELIR